MSLVLGVRPWMATARVRAVLDALAAEGGAAASRFVGGCVRDSLLGEPVGDIDIATRLPPERVIRALEAAGLKAIPTGVEHGTVTAISGGEPFEITTLRRDVETDGRRAVVAFTDDWTEDAQRRDFRLNALYADPDGTLHDPTGGGLADIEARRIVFVGDPETRIREDALRILRYFRFLARFGHGAPDAAALAACQRLKGLIGGLSAERIGQEMLKLLDAEDPRGAVQLMAQTSVLTQVLADAQGLARFEQLVVIETEMLFTRDPLLRLAALLPDDPAAASAAAQRLRLSAAQKARLEAALQPEPKLVSWLGPREVRRLVYRLGVEAFCDRVMLAWAAAELTRTTPQWRMLLPTAQSWPIPKLPLTGEEVMAAGVPAGPAVGRVLREVEAWWIDQDFIDDKLSIVERLKAVSQGMAF
jgi:poly(A) polymerase